MNILKILLSDLGLHCLLRLFSQKTKGHSNNCVFRSGRIRTLVAMATYSSHRLIMGKEEIDNFFCLIWDIWIFFINVY